MSYLVLALKWRPKTFEEVVGQAHVTRTLKNSLAMGRMAHAYLFAGPRGVGKTSVARILAKAINCKSDEPPCGECDICREITRGSSVDVLEIDGASNRGINEIRELRENVKFLPAYAKYKVYIVDEVHMLTKEAFNAFLKTLEEPPPHVVFVLATTDPHKVPLTVLSRCQRYDFRRISASESVAHLESVAEGEGAELKPEVFEMIAREADGSLRDALSLMEQVLALGADLGADELLNLLGVADRRLVRKVASGIINRDAPVCLDAVGELFGRGLDARRFIQDLTSLFRDLMVLRLAPGSKELAHLGPEEAREVLAEAEKVPVDSLQMILDLLVLGQEDVRRSLMPRLALEVLLMRLLRLGDLAPVSRVLARAEEDAAKSGDAELPDPWSAPPPREEPPGPEPPASPDEGGEKPGDFREYVSSRDPALATKLDMCEVRDGPEDTVVLKCNGSALLYEMLSEAPVKSRLSKYVREYFGPGKSLEIDQTGEPGPEVRDGEKSLKTDLERKLFRDAFEHPLVKEALRLFDGEVVKVRVGDKEEGG